MARPSFLSLVLLLLTPLVAFVVADEDLYKPGTDVVILTEETFEEKILKQDNLAFVQFYSSTCGPSIDFVDEYEKAATALKGLATVAVINGKTISQEMRDKYDIKGYPRVLIFGADMKTPRKYSAKRTARRMVEEVKRMAEVIPTARLTAMGENGLLGSGPDGIAKKAGADVSRSAAVKPEKAEKAGGCGCNKDKDKDKDKVADPAGATTPGQSVLKDKDEAAAATAAACVAADGTAPCPHCGKSEPGSCSKCARQAAAEAAAAVEEEAVAVAAATAPPTQEQEPFIVTEDMVWQEDEL